MSHRTPKRKAFYPRQEHERRGRRRIKARHLKRRAKAAFKPYNPRVAAQIECHRVFDQLWCGPDAPMTRSRAYAYLRRITGMTEEECHIGQMDIGLCEAVAAQILDDYPKLSAKSA